jgi:parallel beta helix pectate lyase-like protein
MRVKTILVAAGLAGLAMLLFAGPAAADVIKVSPGEKIQAAIDQASPGDTVKVAPGTYQENVQIRTQGITLKGSGDETLIEAPATPAAVDPICDGAGICVSDFAGDPAGPPPTPSLADVRVKDLKVQGFGFSGVLFFATVDQRVTDVSGDGNPGYGIAAFNTTGGQYWDNVTSNNGEAGLYVGDSPEANAVVRDNEAYGNGIGLFFRDAAHGVVEENESHDNCIGILFLDTPDDPSAPTPNSDWTARDNDVNHNNKACPAGDEGDATSGLGIVINGAHAITLVDNTTNDNQPSGPTAGSGGIVIITDPGSPLSTDNVIKDNKAFGNLPFDILWDEQGTNTFIDNRCETSSPDGLCVTGHGNGHHGDDGDDDDDHGDHGVGGKGDHGNGHHKHHKKHGKHHKGKHGHDD